MKKIFLALLVSVTFSSVSNVQAEEARTCDSLKSEFISISTQVFAGLEFPSAAQLSNLESELAQAKLSKSCDEVVAAQMEAVLKDLRS